MNTAIVASVRLAGGIRPRERFHSACTAHRLACRREMPVSRRGSHRIARGYQLPAGRPWRSSKPARSELEVEHTPFAPGSPCCFVCCLPELGRGGSRRSGHFSPPASGSPQPIFGEADHVPTVRCVTRASGRGGRSGQWRPPHNSRPLDVCQDHRGGVSNRHERSGVVHAEQETPAWTVRPSFLQRQIIIGSIA